MLDSLNKRVNFLNQTISILGLQNAQAIHFRAEDFAKEKRENYDIAIARAVASLNTLSEYCLPFVKVGGSFIALKGSSYKEELLQAQNAIKTLGGEVKEVNVPSVPEIDGERAIIFVQKVEKTPNKYPRGKNQPRTNPL